MKGHIALFVCLSPQGEPVILHNLWGVRVASEKDPGLSGRIVAGRGSIDAGGLLGRVVTLTFLPGFEPAEK